jgi:hypothetical protein
MFSGRPLHTDDNDAYHQLELRGLKRLVSGVFVPGRDKLSLCSGPRGRTFMNSSRASATSEMPTATGRKRAEEGIAQVLKQVP